MTTTSSSSNNSALKRSIGLAGVVSLGMGTAVGVSIFSILTPTYQLAGPAMLISMVLASIPMIIFALIYAFMGSAVPVTGASFEWPRRYISPFVGFFISWLRIAGSTAALIVLTMVLVSYLGNGLDVPVKLSMFIIFCLVLIVNLIGISAAAVSQTLMLFILIIACGIYAAAGVPQLEIANFTPFLSGGVIGVFIAIPLMISLFLGIESAVEVGGEIKSPEKTIPLGISISVFLTCLVYFIVAVVSIGVLGAETGNSAGTPLLNGAEISMGKFGVWLILLTALVSIGSSINATFIIMTRFIYAMAKAGMLPRILARVHNKSGVPTGAIFLTFALCCLGLFMPQNLVFLFLAVNIPTVLKYTAVCVCSLNLLKRTPELYEQSYFKLPKFWLRTLAVLGIIMGLGIIVLGATADWRSFLALGLWAILGVLFYIFYVKRPIAE